MHRRRFLAGTGSMAGLGLAGCLGGGDAEHRVDADTPTSIVTTYYDLVEAGLGAVLANAGRVFHTESPSAESMGLDRFETFTVDTDQRAPEEGIRSVSVRVLSEDPDEDAIRTSVEPRVDPEAVDGVVDLRVTAQGRAIVEATLEIVDPDHPEGTERTHEWFVATDSGRWQLVA